MNKKIPDKNKYIRARLRKLQCLKAILFRWYFRRGQDKAAKDLFSFAKIFLYTQ